MTRWPDSGSAWHLVASCSSCTRRMSVSTRLILIIFLSLSLSYCLYTSLCIYIWHLPLKKWFSLGFCPCGWSLGLNQKNYILKHKRKHCLVNFTWNLGLGQTSPPWLGQNPKLTFFYFYSYFLFFYIVILYLLLLIFNDCDNDPVHAAWYSDKDCGNKAGKISPTPGTLPYNFYSINLNLNWNLNLYKSSIKLAYLYLRHRFSKLSKQVYNVGHTVKYLGRT